MIEVPLFVIDPEAFLRAMAWAFGLGEVVEVESCGETIRVVTHRPRNVCEEHWFRWTAELETWIRTHSNPDGLRVEVWTVHTMRGVAS